MKLTIPIVALSFFTIVSHAGDVILDTFTFENNNGKVEFVFPISEARLDRQPVWAPGKQPVPLAIDKAIQAAQAWIGKQSWSKQIGDIDQVTLENQNNCWFYYVDFDQTGDLTHANLDAVFVSRVMVLLDGSVVEPRRKKPGDPPSGL